MSSERWVLAGLSDAPALETLKKAVSKAGHRTTVVSSLEEFAETTARRTFLCAFFDASFLGKVAKKCPFQVPTYTVLMTSPQEAQRAISLQGGGRVHDWLTSPIREECVAAALLRARTFLRMSGELETIKSAKARAIAEDSELLCTGKWAETARRWIESVKKGSDSLCLVGEPGTGKTLLAQLVHYASPRAGAPFVIVPCHGRNARELEKEIFGEIPPRNRASKELPCRSSFTRAANGTILFDEIEAVPRRMQQRIAHSAASHTFSPVGGGDRVKTEARLLFTIQDIRGKDPVRRALHPDLSRLLRKTTLRIPPLRERKVDFPSILKKVLERLAREFAVRSPGITDDAIEALQQHHWPGNIRELEGVVWAASVLAGASKISAHTLAPFLAKTDLAIQGEEEALEALVENRLGALFRKFGVEHMKDLHPMILERVERPLFSLVLRHTKGNQLRAAQILGLNRNTLRKKLAEYGITPAPPSQPKLFLEA